MPLYNKEEAIKALSQAELLSAQANQQGVPRTVWPIVTLLVAACVYTGLEIASAIRGNVR